MCHSTFRIDRYTHEHSLVLADQQKEPSNAEMTLSAPPEDNDALNILLGNAENKPQKIKRKASKLTEDDLLGPNGFVKLVSSIKARNCTFVRAT